MRIAVRHRLHRREQRSEFAKHGGDPTRRSDAIIGGSSPLPITRFRLQLGFLESGKRGVSPAFLSNLSEHLSGFRVLSLADDGKGCGIAHRLRTTLAQLVIAPRHDPAGRHQDERHQGYNVAPITRPELQQIVSTELFVDFAENVAHKRPGRPRLTELTIAARSSGSKPPVTATTSLPCASRIRRLDAATE